MIFNLTISSRFISSALATLTCVACLTFLTYHTAALAEQQAPTRIMPLGDSITQGNTESYRRLLWLQLKKAKMNVDFVGSLNQTYSGDLPTPDYDVDHEGHWGWRADEVLKYIDDWAAEARPDIVLIHIGTNDVGSGEDVTETTEKVSKIITRLRKHNADIHILLAAIIPIAYEGATEPISRFNTAQAALAKKYNTNISRVLFIDQFEGFDAERDTYDGVHPNIMGNQKMAAKWFAGLKELLLH